MHKILKNSGASKGNPLYTWNGIKKYWRYSYDTMTKLERENRIYYSSSGMPYLKHYLDEMKGISVDDLWNDIKPAKKSERIGYPTQKPEDLLERIIKSCTKKGDLVADFFCGCGTAVSVSQKLGRKWIGVDISHLAIHIIEKRLIDTYGSIIKKTIQIHGFPKDLESAKMLARETIKDNVSFKEWVIEVLLHGITNNKSTKIKSYDGYLPFIYGGQQEFALIKTATKRVKKSDIQTLKRALKKQGAILGIFVCFGDSLTVTASNEAKLSGTFSKNSNINRIQLLTVDSLMDGAQPHLPIVVNYKKAESNLRD